ncbi:MAG: hypothetical protein B9S35_15240 [Opitutia bacterium Tous-C5TDCM]|nr:MAG: hypothetical protein B9S35_15240 [Opitutae bacterium Tous-C5TDCM]
MTKSLPADVGKQAPVFRNPSPSDRAPTGNRAPNLKPQSTPMKSTLLISLATLALVPAGQAVSLYGITSGNQLVNFDTAAPSVFTSSVSVSGLVGSDGVTPDPGAAILNLTARPGISPGTFQLYGIDSNANFYSINLGGAATLLSNTLSPSGFSGGLAHDPFSDSLAFLTDASENFSLSLAGAVTNNPTLFYGVGDPNSAATPNIFGLGIDPASGSATFMLDSDLDTLAQSFTPDLSELFSVGSLGLDVTSFGGLVVDFDGNLFASLSVDGLESSLYSINPLTGAATPVGVFGTGISSIAVPEPSAALLGGLGLLALLRRRRA